MWNWDSRRSFQPGEGPSRAFSVIVKSSGTFGLPSFQALLAMLYISLLLKTSVTTGRSAHNSSHYKENWLSAWLMKLAARTEHDKRGTPEQGHDKWVPSILRPVNTSSQCICKIVFSMQHKIFSMDRYSNVQCSCIFVTVGVKFQWTIAPVWTSGPPVMT